MLFFLYICFPSESIKTHLANRLSSMSPQLRVSIERLKPALPPGIRLFNVQLYHQENFWGGVDDQKILPFGTPEDVEREVRLRLEQLAPEGGYILCSSHNVQATTPLANVRAFYDASERFRSYPMTV